MVLNEQNLDMKQAASRLGVHRNTLDSMVNNGEIAFCRVRGRVFIPESVINNYIASKTGYKTKEALWAKESVVTRGKFVSKSTERSTKKVLDQLLRSKTQKTTKPKEGVKLSLVT